MSKTVKYVILGALILLGLVIIVPLIGGMLSTANPNKAIQYAEQKKAENKELFVPIGYTVEKKAEAKSSDYGTLYVTKMINQSNNVQIIQSPKSSWKCIGKNVTLANTNICYYNIGDLQAQPNDKVLMWNSGNLTFQLETNDSALSDLDLGKIIESL